MTICLGTSTESSPIVLPCAPLATVAILNPAMFFMLCLNLSLSLPRFCFLYTIPIYAYMTVTSTYSIHLHLVPRYPRFPRFRICPMSTRKHGTLGFLGNLGTSCFYAKRHIFCMIFILHPYLARWAFSNRYCQRHFSDALENLVHFCQSSCFQEKYSYFIQ